MRPVRIENHTNELGAPVDWSPEENGRCGVLYVRQQELSGIPFMCSAWEAEPKEAILLASGARLVLGIAGRIDPPRRSHPVVNLSIGACPDEFQPVVMARHIAAADGAAAVHIDVLYANNGEPRVGSVAIFLEGHGFANAVAIGIEQIEILARREGWID